MRIAIDFDDTFDSDVKLWRTIVNVLKQAGHEVKIVTARGEGGKTYTPTWHSKPFTVSKSNNDDIYKAIDGLDIDVIFCGWEQKMDVCVLEHKWVPNIWIDDSPETIVESFLLKP